MLAIVGAGGKVGYATAAALREANMPVLAIVRDESKASQLRAIGCEIAVADLHDPKALAKAIGNAEDVQVILPPSPRAKDGAQEMRTMIESLGIALEEAGPKQVLAISDYGAHVPHDIGMPTMCRAFEERLRKVDNCHKVFLRSAEHMQNWARIIPMAVASGTLPTFHEPVNMLHPTISAPDLGKIAADLLLRPVTIGNDSVEIIHAEGPRRYSANDVAVALSQLSSQAIHVDVVPRSQWKEVFERAMSPSLAELLIKANDAQNRGGLVDVEPGSAEVRHGTTELVDALRPLIPPQ